MDGGQLEPHALDADALTAATEGWVTDGWRSVSEQEASGVGGLETAAACFADLDVTGAPGVGFSLLMSPAAETEASPAGLAVMIATDWGSQRRAERAANDQLEALTGCADAIHPVQLALDGGAITGAYSEVLVPERFEGLHQYLWVLADSTRTLALVTTVHAQAPDDDVRDAVAVAAAEALLADDSYAGIPELSFQQDGELGEVEPVKPGRGSGSGG